MCLYSNEIREKIPEQVKKLSNYNIFIETHGIYIYIYVYIYIYIYSDILKRHYKEIEKSILYKK